MQKVIKHGELILFADDGLLFVSENDVDNCKAKLKEDTLNIRKYLDMNKLKLNVDKTKVMFLNGIWPCDSFCGFECVKKIKYLGVIIDSNLNFKCHFVYVRNKIAKKIGFFRRIRKDICTLTAIKIYNSIIRPHFEYCVTVLFLGSAEVFDKMQKLQNKAMRCILKCNRYTSINYMLETLRWLNVKQRTVMCVLIFIFKIKNNLMPIYLSRKLSMRIDVQPYNLRGNNNFNLQLFRNRKSQNMLFYKGLKIYNELPTHIKSETNLVRFKYEVNSFVKINQLTNF